MDPNASWEELCDLLDGPLGEDDCDRALELVGSLLAWVDRGGFVPQGTGLSRQALLRFLEAMLVQLGAKRDLLCAARENWGQSYQMN